MPLTDRQIRNLKTPGSQRKISDGEGLHLLLTPSGGRLWRLAYRFGGKQKTLAFGKYPHVSLAEARQKRDKAKGHLARGIDPSLEARAERLRSTQSHANTFGAIANEFLEKTRKEGKAEATLTKKAWLLDLARPDLGGRPISEISSADILVPLRRIEAKGQYESARRLRSTIGQVFRYAIATARAENDPTFGLQGALITPTVVHRAAVTDWTRFADLLRSIWDYSGSYEARAGLQLLAMLYSRPGELRLAKWSEFDLEKRIWTIPAERAKMRKEHTKPLPEPAIKIIEALNKVTGHWDLLLPSVSAPKRPISENTFNAALRRMGFQKDEMTAHGFRATASTLLNESGKWHPDAIEAELAHVGSDDVRRAYHRAAYWDERVQMAEWWSEQITEIVSTLEK